MKKKGGPCWACRSLRRSILPASPARERACVSVCAHLRTLLHSAWMVARWERRVLRHHLHQTSSCAWRSVCGLRLRVWRRGSLRRSILHHLRDGPASIHMACAMLARQDGLADRKHPPYMGLVTCCLAPAQGARILPGVNSIVATGSWRRAPFTCAPFCVQR